MAMVTRSAMVALAALWVGFVRQAPPVRVYVTESTAAGVTTYSYRVVNGSSLAIMALRVGYDDSTDNPQLRAAPLGWTFEQGLPASSASAPPGWVPRYVTLEESDLAHMAWSADEGPQWRVAPGTTATGFSVRLVRPAPEYRTSKFDVLLANSTYVAGSLQPDPEPRRR